MSSKQVFKKQSLDCCRGARCNWGLRISQVAPRVSGEDRAATLWKPDGIEFIQKPFLHDLLKQNIQSTDEGQYHRCGPRLRTGSWHHIVRPPPVKSLMYEFVSLGPPQRSQETANVRFKEFDEKGRMFGLVSRANPHHCCERFEGEGVDASCVCIMEDWNGLRPQPVCELRGKEHVESLSGEHTVGVAPMTSSHKVHD